MKRIEVYCDNTECKHNDHGTCQRESEFVNLDSEAKCEDYEEGEDEG